MSAAILLGERFWKQISLSELEVHACNFDEA